MALGVVKVNFILMASFPIFPFKIHLYPSLRSDYTEQSNQDCLAGRQFYCKMVFIYYFAGFYASFYLFPASAGCWLRMSIEGSQGCGWAVHSEVLDLHGQKMGMEVIQSTNSVCFNHFLCVVKGFIRLNENKSVTNWMCCVRQRVTLF